MKINNPNILGVDLPKDIPKKVLEAYKTLEQYINKDYLAAERMVSQLQSNIVSNMWGIIFKGSAKMVPPSWLLKKKPKLSNSNLPDILDNSLDWHWMDHWLYWKRKETGEFLTSQPYRFGHGVTLDEMKDLIQTCKALDIDCVISPLSPHYPTRTLLFVFKEKKNKN